MLSTGKLRDWYAIVEQVLRHSMLKASVDSQSELIQNPLRDVQPVQVNMQ